MSWLANLYKTYEKHTRDVGQFEKKKNNREYALIPVSHTTQSAHIEVNLDGEGNYLSAKVIDKNEGALLFHVRRPQLVGQALQFRIHF